MNNKFDTASKNGIINYNQKEIENNNKKQILLS